MLFDKILSNQKFIDVKSIIKDKVVLIALSENISGESIVSLGAKDCLVLAKSGETEPRRSGVIVKQKYKKLSDIRKNNCKIAILHGLSIFALAEKAKFGRFEYVLIPIGFGIMPAWFGVLRYKKRNGLKFIGQTNIGNIKYAVLKTNIELRDTRRQYGPTGKSALEILKSIKDLNQIILRWSEDIENNRHEGDMDILIARKDIDLMLERFGQCVSTYPLDIYSDDGAGGYAYKSVPYYTRNLADRLLKNAFINDAGIKVSDNKSRFLGFCYHLMFHNKSERVAVNTNEIGINTFHSQHYYKELVRLSELADMKVPKSFDEIESLFKSENCFPSLDLIGFYSRKNEFLKARYFDKSNYQAGLATFFIRDFGQGDVTNAIRQKLASKFEIILEGDINSQNSDSIINGVRGGNWADPLAPSGLALPVYWFVCFDNNPKKPRGSVVRKHPRLDNENVRIKDDIRNLMGSGDYKIKPIIHSSDNVLEALDHIEHLGLSDNIEIKRRLS